MVRMQKEKRRGENLTPKPKCPLQPVFLINHYISVKILTEKWSSVIALFGLSLDILIISSLKTVCLQMYSGAKIAVFSHMMEEAVSFLGRVARRLLSTAVCR